MPRIWKDATITSIFKKGDNSNPGNYRPVSLTSIVCKVMESIIRDKIMKHLHLNDLLSECQHGFIPMRSCVTNLLEVINKWTGALDEGKPIDAVYLDFAKAFDSVPHQHLILKIDSYGIMSKVQNWIRAFLTDRRQRVSISGSVSEWSPVTSGVQGSILGPVLFVIFINDLPDVLNSWCQMYADDTKYQQQWTLKRKVRCSTDVEWADRWQLHFNAAKCKVIHLGRNNPAHKYTMKMHNSEDNSIGTYRN